MICWNEVMVSEGGGVPLVFHVSARNMVEKKADGATTKNVAEERPTEFH